MNGRLFRSLQEKAEELRGLKEYNENILESLDSGIVVLDLESRVVRWNRAMEALFARSRQEVLGRALETVFPGSSSRRCVARSSSATTRRSRTSTSCTCPRRTAAASW